MRLVALGCNRTSHRLSFNHYRLCSFWHCQNTRTQSFFFFFFVFFFPAVRVRGAGAAPRRPWCGFPKLGVQIPAGPRQRRASPGAGAAARRGRCGSSGAFAIWLSTKRATGFYNKHSGIGFQRAEALPRSGVCNL